MSDLLTRVATWFLPEYLDHWVRFGEARHIRYLDRRRGYQYFRPGQIFAYVRWEANEFGTIEWRIFVIRAGDATALLDRIPGIAPGGELLLDLQSGKRVKKVFQAIDAVEALELDPSDIDPGYWTYVQNRILTRLPVRPYTADQHKAYLLRSRVLA